MAIDYTLGPDEILVQLINVENNRNFKITDLDLSSVSIAPDPVSGRPAYNNVRTSIGVAAATGSGYKGGVTVKYNRVPLRSVFPTTDAADVRYPVSSDQHQLNSRVNLVDILADINAKYAINIRAEDVFDVPLPVFKGPPPYDPAYVRLEMQAGSKVFHGGINLRIMPDDWDLAGLTYTEMNGLEYPDYSEPSPIPADWTAIDNQINLIASQGFWNYVTQDPGDGTTPASASALASFNTIDTTIMQIAAEGAFNYQPQSVS